MKRMLFLLAMVSVAIGMKAQIDDYYLDWKYTAVSGIYQEISAPDTANYSNEIAVLSKDSVLRFFVKEMYADGVYEVQVDNEVTENLWGMVGSFYFILFRNNPFLYSFDEGILVWEGLDGGFYKQP